MTDLKHEFINDFDVLSPEDFAPFDHSPAPRRVESSAPKTHGEEILAGDSLIRAIIDSAHIELELQGPLSFTIIDLIDALNNEQETPGLTPDDRHIMTRNLEVMLGSEIIRLRQQGRYAQVNPDVILSQYKTLKRSFCYRKAIQLAN